MTWTFAKHQEYAKFMMDSCDALAIFYEAGTGKTAIALWWLRDALRDGRIEDALVICPASLIPSWERAIDGMSNFESFSQDDIELLRRKLTIVSFQRTYKRNRPSKKVAPLRDEVDKPWGAIIVDESHCIGSHSSVQTMAAIALGKMSQFNYILSGTPTHGGGGGADYSKLYGQYQFLSKGTLWKHWTDFCAHAVSRYDKWFKPCSYNNDYCEEIMARYAIVCRLEDCYDMPGTLETEMPCPLEESTVYSDLKRGRIEKYGIEITVAGAQYIKMLQVCSGSMKRESDTLMFKTSKDDVLRTILEGTEDKVVVFCNYHASIDRCVEVCKAAGRVVQTFDGRTKGDTWIDLVEGRCDVLICQYQSGGVGLNLQVSHTMVFYEPCMSSLLMSQAYSRIYRKGQSEKCIFYYLVTPDTVESRVLETVRSGVDVNAELLERFAQETI